MLSLKKKRAILLYLSLLEDEDNESDEVALTISTFLDSKRKHRFWIRQHIKYHSEHGEFSTYFRICDDEMFENSYRVSRKVFHELHCLLKPYLQKEDTNFRRSISSEERLALCLKYLSNGTKYSTLGQDFMIGKSTVMNIIQEVCDCIWNVLQPLYMPVPTQEDWYRIAKEFEDLWQFKNCVGALDGKHVYIIAPNKSGSSFFNYKHRFSIVLMCVADAKRKIIMADIGSMGRFSDGGIFAESEFGKRLKNNALNLPQPEPLTENGEQVPFVFVSDEAFPLSNNLMRPYPRDQLDQNKRIFNYRLSRARRIVESTFGVLKRKWYVYHKDFECQVTTVDKVVKATCVLHNYLIEKQTNYLDDTGKNILDKWPNNESLISSINTTNPCVTTNNTSSNQGYRIRDIFCSYFNNQGKVPWQETRILRRLNITDV